MSPTRLVPVVLFVLALVTGLQAAAAEPAAPREQQLAAAVDQMAAQALADRDLQVAGVRIAYGPYYTRVAYRPWFGGYGGYYGGFGYPYAYGYPYYSYSYSPWVSYAYGGYPYYSPYYASSYYTTYYTPYVYSPYSYAAFYRPAVYAPVIAPAPVFVAPPVLVGYGGCYYW